MPESAFGEDVPSFLRGIRGIRHRPAMYIGDTGQRGVNHLLFEIFSNCVDQFCVQRATASRIEIHGRMVRVSDDGEGMPFDLTCRDGQSNVATQYLTSIHYTGTADGHAPHVHVKGLHGVGLVAVNALSESFICRAWRSGKLWEQKFVRGEAVSKPTAIQEGDGRGTIVEFIPDPEIFGTFEVNADEVRGGVQEAAFLHAGFLVHFQDETFHFPGGLAEMVRAELGPAASDIPVFSVHGQTGDVEYFAAAAGRADAETTWRTWCNGFPLVEHGSNKIAFARALRKVKYSPEIAVIHVLMHDPRFTSPTKGLLNNPEIEKPLADAIGTALKQWCRENHIGKFYDLDDSAAEPP